jgi:uncharacterized membrane protein YbhN (UPF0104 family)
MGVSGFNNEFAWATPLMLNKIVRVMTGIFLACFFLYLFFKGVDAQQMEALLRQSRYSDLGVAVALVAAGQAIRILRWSWLLRPVNPAASPGRCVIPYGAALAVNNLLPLRAGDVYRVVGFSRRLGSPSGQVLGTVLVERVLDMLILASLAALGIPLALSGGAAGHGFTEQSWLPIAAIGLAGVLALLLAPRLAGVYRRAYPDASSLSWRWHKAIYPIAAPLANALESFGSPVVWMPAMVLSLLAWLFSGATFMIVGGPSLYAAPVWGAWFSMAVGNLGTLLPGAPGAIGTFHYFAALGLLSCGLDWNVMVKSNRTPVQAALL